MKKILVVLAVLSAAQAFAGGGSSIGPALPPNAIGNCSALGGTIQILTSETNAKLAECVVNENRLYVEMGKRGMLKPGQDASDACGYWEGTEKAGATSEETKCVISPFELGGDLPS